MEMAAYTLDWPTDMKQYELLEVIALGTSSMTHIARCITKNEKCVIKRISFKNWQVSWDRMFIHEIEPMTRTYHDNIVQLYASFLAQREELWLVTKLMKGGSLRDLINYKMGASNCYNGVLDEATIATLLKEVLQALVYFQLNNKIHRDIKAGNILLGEDGTVKLGDFGVSSWIATGRDISVHNSSNACIGNPCWLAPEIMAQEVYNAQVDIWSFGITAIELATGVPPYHNQMPLNVITKTLHEEPPTLDSGACNIYQYSGYSQTFRSMIAECLQRQPDRRPTASMLLNHDFFLMARDKKYLTETLLTNVPLIEERMHMPINVHLNSMDPSYYSGIDVWYSDVSDREYSNREPEYQEIQPNREPDSSTNEEESPERPDDGETETNEQQDIVSPPATREPWSPNSRTSEDPTINMELKII